MEKKLLAGEYYLQGVMEMASGFLLKPDSDFEFFFSYGALDRFGKGTWELSETPGINEEQVVFKSAARPEHDFALVESKTTAGEFITVRITDPTTNFLRNVFSSLQKGEKKSWVPANNEGEIIFPKQEIETISLIFEFSPERFSVFVIKDKAHNDFTFRFEPWIVEVFLDGFTLRVDQHELTGRHPVMEGEKFRYAKQ
jgi:hypothetical protein